MPDLFLFNCEHDFAGRFSAFDGAVRFRRLFERKFRDRNF
jgi:hypothetical protein